MIVGKLMRSVVGIRIVLGLLIASVLGLGAVTWLWREAEKSAASAQAAANTAREVAQSNAQEAQRAQTRANRLDATLGKLRRREQERRQRLKRDVETLRDDLQDSDCAGRAVPDAARERLFGPPDGHRDQDVTGNGAE